MSNPVNEAIQAAGVIADGAVRTIDSLRRELDEVHRENKRLRVEITRLRGDLTLIAEYRKGQEPQDHHGFDLRFVRGIAEISLKGEVK